MAEAPPAVVICPYDPAWAMQFLDLQAQLQPVFPAPAALEHIGSTAVPGLAAKPVLDVLLGVVTLADAEAQIARLAELGFEYVSKYEAVLPQRRYFVRAATPLALRVHLHALQVGSTLWRQHLAFRDALRRDEPLRARYQALKFDLARQHASDKAAYTDAKAPFIQAVLGSMAPT